MPKHRFRSTLDEILFGMTALFLLGGIAALGFLPDLSAENRALILVISSNGILASFGSLIFLKVFRKWRRKRTWRLAIAAWPGIARAEKVPEFTLAVHLSSGGLKHLAMQTYARMGYIVLNHDDEADADMTIRLINPEGMKELVHCKQWREPVGLRQLHALQSAMKRENAVRGFIWAPGGFSNEALHWVKGKPIFLVNNHEIGRLVDWLQKKNKSLAVDGDYREEKQG